MSSASASSPVPRWFDGVLGVLKRIPHSASLGIIGALALVGFAINPAFLSGANVWSVLSIAAMLSIASAGQTLVILSGNQGIDLSVGTIMTFAALLVSGIAGSSDAGMLPATAAAVAMGGLVGLLNGLGVQVLRLYPLIMTLGISFAVEGLGLIYAQARAPSMPGQFIETIGVGRIWGVPWVVVIAAGLLAAMTALLRHSRYGRMLYLVGTNIRAAQAAGVPAARVVIGTYVASGILSALAGVVLFGFAGSVNLSLGAPYTMMSVAAVVIGGVSLSGGNGGFAGTLLGAIIFTLLTNLLITLGFSSALRYIASGLVLFAVLLATSRDVA
ncbi:ABC transporter permease [Ensifer sp. YR511]|uniref:ABC transporter permease n=1 Tax=Ensifer sp. YR511 TaxID=1855294 RepID=UPI00088C3944|nr:ABC transporter permease [Ensifer sp. YR511]SDN35461.1 ribose transport system permease protein [Ensifer sp. YR511]